MAKWVCSVCGYVHEGETAPEACPICKAPADKFTKQAEGMTWAAEHVVGVAQGAPEDIMADLRANFEGECSEVGCIWQWRVWRTEKAILRSVYTGRKPLMKRLNMQRSLQNFLVKLSQTAQRRIWR